MLGKIDVLLYIWKIFNIDIYSWLSKNFKLKFY